MEAINEMSSATKKILIVDDEQPIRTLLEYNLKQERYDTITAADGEEAVLKTESEQPRFDLTGFNAS